MKIKTVPALVYACLEFMLCLIAILNFTVALDCGNKLLLNEDSELAGLADIENVCLCPSTCILTHMSIHTHLLTGGLGATGSPVVV